MNLNYQRVSKKRTCLICGKPDWCSYTPDAKISFCARIITNADRVSPTGWGVFYHEKSLFADAPLPCPSKPPPKKVELAPIEIRDFVYRKLIALSPATKSDEIINGPKGLRERKILDFENYGCLPQTQSERENLAKKIRVLINREFPDFVRKQKSSVAGLPGFWLDKMGKIQLWTEKDYSFPMMLIPYRSKCGLVQACQIRFMTKLHLVNDVRYVWLSVANKNGSISCGSPLHFASYNAQLNKPILITEGALKAETIKKFNTGCDILAPAGVTCSHQEIIAVTQFRPLLMAFDNDYFENLHVARASARLINSIFLGSSVTKIQPRIRILSWNSKIKGLDDALLQNLTITHLSLDEWFNNLNGLFKKDILTHFGFFKNIT